MASLIDLGDGRFRLEGELNLRTVAALARESGRLFPRRRARTSAQPPALERDFELDLGGVTQANSAAVALMIDWLARAQSVGTHLRISNWPESMVRIARFSNVADLLNLQAPPSTTQTPDP
jgi:phospholipid transport system transporter-binding protein